MKKIVIVLALLFSVVFSSCEGPQGIPGQNGQDGLLSEVLDLKRVNFDNTDFIIRQRFITPIFAADAVLIYRLSGIIDDTIPIWQPIPRTIFFDNGDEFDYDFDFSKEDFTIYARGNYNILTTPNLINDQTFRIVILPGYFSGKNKKTVDLNDYNAVIKAFKIDDSRVKILN